MKFQTITTEDLLGPLNEIEKKFAPEKLFVRGDASLPFRHMSVSLVGSRKASELGKAQAKRIAKEIIKRDGIVVSGLAEGIDAAAHNAAIELGGKTIAVIGTPLDQVYPKKHAELQETIARDHLLISQFPSGYPTGRKNFPMRNRTMALVSDATVIVEAGEKSGTIHQGWEALRLGRPLFILKALVQNKNLTWPQKFLEHGAEILDNTKEYWDFFFELLPVSGRGESEALFN